MICSTKMSRLFPKSSYFKKMKTLSNWQGTVTAGFTLEQLSKSIQSAGTISTASDPLGILCVASPHSPLLRSSLLQFTYKSGPSTALFLTICGMKSILTALAFPLTVNPLCDNCLETSSGLGTNITIRAMPSVVKETQTIL